MGNSGCRSPNIGFGVAYGASLANRLSLPMDPDTFEYPKGKKDENEKWAAVTDHRQWYTGNWRDRDRHPDIHERVREYERYHTYSDQASELVRGRSGDKETGKK